MKFEEVPQPEYLNRTNMTKDFRGWLLQGLVKTGKEIFEASRKKYDQRIKQLNNPTEDKKY